LKTSGTEPTLPSSKTARSAELCPACRKSFANDDLLYDDPGQLSLLVIALLADVPEAFGLDFSLCSEWPVRVSVIKIHRKTHFSNLINYNLYNFLFFNFCIIYNNCKDLH